MHKKELSEKELKELEAIRTRSLEISLQLKIEKFLPTARYLKEMLERAIKDVENKDYKMLNGLGILQGNGPALDILAAEIVLLDTLLQERNPQ